jgi:hypothetical protein
METKQFYKSKVLWFNVITIGLGIIGVVAKTFPISQEVLGLITAIGNILLRVFSTNTSIGFGKASFNKK